MSSLRAYSTTSGPFSSLCSFARAAVAALLCLALSGSSTACRGAGEGAPCFPTDDPEDLPWLTHEALGWEIDMMAEIPGVQRTGARPSEAFKRAQRDLKTEFWLDAANRLLTVARGDTRDDRAVRQVAEFQLAIALFRLNYYAEAKRLFQDVSETRGHPMQEEAYQWAHRKACSG